MPPPSVHTSPDCWDLVKISSIFSLLSLLFLFVLFFVFFGFEGVFLAAPTACRSSQARDQSLCHSSDSAGSLTARLPGNSRIDFLFFFCLLRATPTTYGGSQARGPIGAIVASLHQSHSNARSELSLQPTPQLTATLDR